MLEISEHKRREEERRGVLSLLETPASESFDRITRLASQIFNLPIAAISLTDRDRQWFKSRVGIEHCSIPREKAPCSQVAESAEVLVIPDVAENACYADSLLAQSGIRFYAGAPLMTRDGHNLGALCVLGTEPRTVAAAELAALQDLAAMVMSQIELQHAFGRVDPVSGLPNRNQFLDDLADLASEHPDETRLAVLVDLARPEQISAYGRVMGLGRIDDLVRDAVRDLRRLVGPNRALYHTGATQFAFMAPRGAERDAFVQVIRETHQQERRRSSTGTILTSAIGVAVVIPQATKPQDVLRALYSAAQEARASPTSSASIRLSPTRPINAATDCSRTSASRWPIRNSYGWSSSHASTSPPGNVSERKRSCAGTIPSSVPSRPVSSFRWSNSPLMRGL